MNFVPEIRNKSSLLNTKVGSYKLKINYMNRHHYQEANKRK